MTIVLGNKVLDLAGGGVFQTVAADEMGRNAVLFSIRGAAIGVAVGAV